MRTLILSIISIILFSFHAQAETAKSNTNQYYDPYEKPRHCHNEVDDLDNVKIPGFRCYLNVNGDRKVYRRTKEGTRQGSIWYWIVEGEQLVVDTPPSRCRDIEINSGKTIEVCRGENARTENVSGGKMKSRSNLVRPIPVTMSQF